MAKQASFRGLILKSLKRVAQTITVSLFHMYREEGDLEKSGDKQDQPTETRGNGEPDVDSQGTNDSHGADSAAHNKRKRQQTKIRNLKLILMASCKFQPLPICVAVKFPTFYIY